MTASKAVSLNNGSSINKLSSTKTRKTHLIGVSVAWLTTYNVCDHGNPLSLASAKMIRDVTVVLDMPAMKLMTRRIA